MSARVVLLLVLLLAGGGRRAFAQWTVEHTALAVTSSVALVIDWSQAADAVRRSYEEDNAILGAHPSIGSLRLYNLIVLPGNVVVGRLLPPRFRTVWFAAVTGFETALVMRQFQVGLHASFRL